jgi:hypothetical protein
MDGRTEVELTKMPAQQGYNTTRADECPGHVSESPIGTLDLGVVPSYQLSEPAIAAFVVLAAALAATW